MSRLGIDYIQGLVYEGRNDPVYLAVPTPIVSQATLIETPADLSKLPASIERDPFGWIFREDSFDPVSRVRRGRLYQKLGNQGWEDRTVYAHSSILGEAIGRTDGMVRKQLSVYIECTSLLNRPDRGEEQRLAIGVAHASSLWKIVQTEQTVSQDVFVTLRAESALGLLPELDPQRIPLLHFSTVKAAVDRVLTAAYREQPISVVDQCRNACNVLISRWLHQQGIEDDILSKDLNDCINALEAHFKSMRKRCVTLSSALHIPRQLHPRGKEPERAELQLRPVMDDDAAFAIHAVGFVIRELGWARA